MDELTFKAKTRPLHRSDRAQLHNLHLTLQYFVGKEQNILPGTNSQKDKSLLVRRFRFSTKENGEATLSLEQAETMMATMDAQIKKHINEKLQKVIVWRRKDTNGKYYVRGFVQIENCHGHHRVSIEDACKLLGLGVKKDDEVIYFQHVNGKVQDIITEEKARISGASATYIESGEGDDVDDVPVFMRQDLDIKCPNTYEELSGNCTEYDAQEKIKQLQNEATVHQVKIKQLMTRLKTTYKNLRSKMNRRYVTSKNRMKKLVNVIKQIFKPAKDGEKKEDVGEVLDTFLDLGLSEDNNMRKGWCTCGSHTSHKDWKRAKKANKELDCTWTALTFGKKGRNRKLKKSTYKKHSGQSLTGVDQALADPDHATEQAMVKHDSGESEENLSPEENLLRNSLQRQPTSEIPNCAAFDRRRRLLAAEEGCW